MENFGIFLMDYSSTLIARLYDSLSEVEFKETFGTRLPLFKLQA
jgi:hypothetical protein